MTPFCSSHSLLRLLQPRQITGRVLNVQGLSVRAVGFPFPIGGLIEVIPQTSSTERMRGEVIGCDQFGTVIMLFDTPRGLAPGDQVVGLKASPTVAVGPRLLGRVINAHGHAIDGGDAISETIPAPVMPPPISALDREPIREPLATGVRAIDCMTTVGRGQRIGIFAGPGIGKSTLLATIAENTDADINVIALVGERGREVQEFLEHGLGEVGLARSVVIVATGDESPLMRVRAALAAHSVAEYFRDEGADVMLMMDSLSRFCQAQRQIGLSSGEPPATRGYTPSVFAQLASLLERAGNKADGGSITGFYTVLVEGDDMTEPISDASRAILDGHISLTRKLANRGHYPAIDVLDSVSRVADHVSTPHHQQARRRITSLLSLYAEVEELVNIGAYVSGANAEYDVAIELKPKIDALLQQAGNESAPFEESISRMMAIALEAGQAIANRSSASDAPPGYGNASAPAASAVTPRGPVASPA